MPSSLLLSPPPCCSCCSCSSPSHYAFFTPLSRRLHSATILCRSFRPRPRSRKNLKQNLPNLPSSPSDSNLHSLTIDLDSLSRSSSSFRTLLQPSLSNFVSSAADAYTDLQTLISLDHNRRLVLSCRPSTLQLLGTTSLLTFLSFSFLRAFLGLVSRFRNWRRTASSNAAPLVRRDRSLGGKEVVVSLSDNSNSDVVSSQSSRVLVNPLSLSSPDVASVKKRGGASSKSRARVQRRLPTWWPTVLTRGAFMEYDEEYRRDAYRLVRAIKDSRMAGKDIKEEEIVQLRQICRISGVQVSIDPPNIRDSLFRASVEFVLNVCGRAPSYSTSIDINGEDCREFLAGFAENVGLENSRAAIIVSAAVAARTRSCLLQAWALEMQGKHDQTRWELSKICLLLRIFPPEDSSPEMEMVARGLGKHLQLEQRKHLMDIFAEVCDDAKASLKIAREALGLIHLQDYYSDQLEDRIL